MTTSSRKTWQPKKCILTKPVNFGTQPRVVGAEVLIENELHYNYLKSIGALKEVGGNERT